MSSKVWTLFLLHVLTLVVNAATSNNHQSRPPGPLWVTGEPMQRRYRPPLQQTKPSPPSSLQYQAATLDWHVRDRSLDIVPTIKVSPLSLVAGGALLLWFRPPLLDIIRSTAMLLAKFIEGFIFGIKKTNRLDNDDVSGGEELLILADQVSTGIKEIEEQLNQAPVVPEENESNENEAEGVVNRDPENSLEKETNEKVDGEQTRWWLGGKKEEEQESVKEEEQEEEEEKKEKTEEEEKKEEESSRKDLLDLANDFYQKAQKENLEKVNTVEYVPYDPTTFPKEDKNTTTHDELVTIDSIDVVEGLKIEETERMEANQIVDKVKMSLVEFDKEREENLNNNKETGSDKKKEENLILANNNNNNKEKEENLILANNNNNNKEKEENLILANKNNNNKGTEFKKENLMLVSSNNKGTGLFDEVDLAPTIIKEVGDGKKDEIEKEIKDDGIVETEDNGMFDKVSVTVKVKPVETKSEFQDEIEKKKLSTTKKETNLIKSEAELEDDILTDWFKKMEDALNGVTTGPKQW